MDERLHDQLDLVAPRARKFFAHAGRDGAARALESASARSGPPDERDRRAIKLQLVRAWSGDVGRVALDGRDAVAEAGAIAALLVARARAAVDALQNGASDGSLDAADLVALESVLRTRGRPALRMEGVRIEPLDAELHPGCEMWRDMLGDHELDIAAAAGATGAVRVRDIGASREWVQGSAWLVAPDLVVTNRHVLFPPRTPALARRRPGAATSAAFLGDFSLTIDFAFDHGMPRAGECIALDVPFVSEERDPVDVALIRIVRPPSFEVCMDALPLRTGSAGMSGLYVVGHPGRMASVPEEVSAVFGTPDERKRVSLGEAMDGTGADLFHDASTIGGYSGGCVVGFGSRSVIGLHYYGDSVRGNRAITSEALRAHPVFRHLEEAT
jgi:hypothetical protein